ncbi:hypothetical protein BGZ46_004189, partial [Entomortierella lignicola]
QFWRIVYIRDGISEIVVDIETRLRNLEKYRFPEVNDLFGLSNIPNPTLEDLFPLGNDISCATLDTKESQQALDLVHQCIQNKLGIFSHGQPGRFSSEIISGALSLFKGELTAYENIRILGKRGRGRKCKRSDEDDTGKSSLTDNSNNRGCPCEYRYINSDTEDDVGDFSDNKTDDDTDNDTDDDADGTPGNARDDSAKNVSELPHGFLPSASYGIVTDGECWFFVKRDPNTKLKSSKNVFAYF